MASIGWNIFKNRGPSLQVKNVFFLFLSLQASSIARAIWDFSGLLSTLCTCCWLGLASNKDFGSEFSSETSCHFNESWTSTCWLCSTGTKHETAKAISGFQTFYCNKFETAGKIINTLMNRICIYSYNILQRFYYSININWSKQWQMVD